MALHIFGKRIRRSIHSRFLRTESLRVSVFDYQMYVPLLSMGMGRALAGTGYRELDQRYVLQRVVKPGDHVLDMGANIGYYVSMYASLLGGHGRIHAIEPDPRSVPFLTKNIELNGLSEIATVDCLALSDMNGNVPFFQAEEPNLSGLAVSRLERRYIGEVLTPVQDFAEYLDSIGDGVDLLRMDIEGHEVEVLRSLARSLKDGTVGVLPPKTIVFEPHAWEYVDSDMEMTLRELFQWGYQAAFLCTAHEAFSPLLVLGYEPRAIIHSNDHLGGDYVHGVYQDVRNEDAIRVIAGSPGLTTVCLQNESQPTICSQES
jgi:FkbM family methyltransferase